MDPTRSTAPRDTARLAGVWFLLTFVFSIPALWFYSPVLHDHAYVVGGGDDTRVAIGAIFEILLVIANIATAVVLFPVLRRHSERVALGYVASRTIESAVIAMGIISLLAMLTLRQDLHGTADGSAAMSTSVVVAGRSLLAVHNWTFLLGPTFCAGFGNGLLLGYLMFRSGLVPRRMAIVGLVGGPLAFLAGSLAVVGAYHLGSTVQGLLTVPEIIWEAFLGLYLTFHGFRQTSAGDGTAALSIPESRTTEPSLLTREPVAAKPLGQE